MLRPISDGTCEHRSIISHVPQKTNVNVNRDVFKRTNNHNYNASLLHAHQTIKRGG